MKAFIAALATIAMVMASRPSVSQNLFWNPLQGSLPDTVPWSIRDEPVGTATVGPDNRMYLRATDGTFVATVVFHRDGTRTIYDPNGKVIDQAPDIRMK